MSIKSSLNMVSILRSDKREYTEIVWTCYDGR